MEDVRHVGGDTARAALAALLLPSDAAAEAVGAITLWPRQRIALARVMRALEEFGGALLADEVGSGKTFVALVAARRHRAPLIVAPAALRDAWHRAMERAELPLPFISIEALSRGDWTSRGDELDLVVVDEAHHARNPATRRYEALARLTANAHVLLLTATPIHNGRRDLLALLALFLGARASAIDDATMARCVVRVGPDLAAPVPRVDGPVELPLDYDDGVIAERIVALPPAIPPVDGGVAQALDALGLLRRWSSSDGSLRTSLRRRIAVGEALADALATGRRLTRHELALWTLNDDVQQLALPGLLASPATRRTTDVATHQQLAAHVGALRDLLRHTRTRPSPDGARAGALAALLREHRGEKAIAFTQFAETARAYWSRLRNRPGVGMLTARGGVVAGGRLPRAEMLRRFAPRALAASPPSEADRIDCLLTTDILSEGLDLQDASIVVHLDQPWTPARLEQRVGRAVRPGSVHARVLVRIMPPPARGEELLRMGERLRAKLEAARGALGDVLEMASGITARSDAAAAPAAKGAIITRIVEGWRRPVAAPGHPFVATVRAHAPGWLVAIDRGGGALLVACLDGAVSEEPDVVARACELAAGADVCDRGAVSDALAAIGRWIAGDDAARLAGVTDIGVVAGRRALSRAAASVAWLPRSRRNHAARAADAARLFLNGTAGIGRERELTQVAARGLETLDVLAGCSIGREFRRARLLGAVVLVAEG